jgi:GNAT superfamily N-acetyltransferase
LAELEVVTSADRPDLDDEAEAAFRIEWPEFIFHDAISSAHIDRVTEYFPRYNIMVLDAGEVVAGGWGVPFTWDGSTATLPDGYDGGLVAAVTDHENGTPPDTLSVMAAAVKNGKQGKGLAGEVLTALRNRATEAGLQRVIAPVRPTLKPRYPLTSMAEFATWARPDGLHIDPWIRTHQRLGATLLAPAPRSMIITGTVSEWESWTQMLFPATAQYVIPDALDLLHINREKNEGTYTEPNLWMQHL